jgi:hypothetical protein
MKKLLAALFAGLFALTHLSAIAAEDKKEEKKEMKADDKKADDKKADDKKDGDKKKKKKGGCG